MRGIVFDTCTERGVLAIVDGTTVIFQALLPFGLQNAQLLLPKLHEGLSETQLSLNALDYIAVGVGPGSYTGIRVGATAAKTLAYACQLPLIGICTLDAFVPDREGPFAVVIDAKIGGVYMQTGIQQKGSLEKTSGPLICAVDEAVKRLQGIPTLVTPNAEKIRPKFEPAFSGHWIETAPSCQRLANLAQTQLKAGNTKPFELLYMRKTQAELEKINNR